MKKLNGKQQKLLADYEERRERMEIEAWDMQRTMNIRELGPLAEAYTTLLNWLDKQIASLKNLHSEEEGF